MLPAPEGRIWLLQPEKDGRSDYRQTAARLVG